MGPARATSRSPVAAAYAGHGEAQVAITSSSGMFLLLVFSHFGRDDAKETHRIGREERWLAASGR